MLNLCSHRIKKELIIHRKYHRISEYFIMRYLVAKTFTKLKIDQIKVTAWSKVDSFLE